MPSRAWWAAGMSRPDVCLRDGKLQPGPEPDQEAGSSATGTPGTGHSCRDHSPPAGGAPAQWASGKRWPHRLGPRGRRAGDTLDRARGSRSDRSVQTGKV